MKERCYFDVAYVALWNMGDNNVVEVSRVERCVQSVCSFLRRAASKCVAFCRALRDLENHYLGHNPRSLHSTSHGVSEKVRTYVYLLLVEIIIMIVDIDYECDWITMKSAFIL